MYKELSSILGENFKIGDNEGNKYVDKFFIDTSEEKILLICKAFNSMQELLDTWEIIQNEDITLNMQRNKFKNQDIRWDMYFLIFYNGIEKFFDGDFYRIERVRFCCKKIIINAQSKDLLREYLEIKLPLLNKLNTIDDTSIASDDYFFNCILQNLKQDKFEIIKVIEKDGEDLQDFLKFLRGDKIE